MLGVEYVLLSHPLRNLLFDVPAGVDRVGERSRGGVARIIRLSD